MIFKKLANKFFNKFKLTFKSILMRYGLSIYLNNKYHLYDKSIFFKGSSINFQREFRSMNKETLSEYITYLYHKLEKGLSLKRIKPNFGYESQLIKEILEVIKYYMKIYGSNDEIILCVYDALNDYYNWHKLRNLDIKENIQEFINNNNFLRLNNFSAKKGGSILIKKKETLEKINKPYYDFFNSRRSVRMFSKENFDNKIIIEAVKNSLNGTPSICNRNINKIYIVEEYSKRKMILSLQNGNSGFGINAPKLLIITSKLNCFFSPTERRAPYIAGGMFSMSLLYALHSSNLACCSLNWDVNPEKDIKLRNILGLKDETIIMLIAVGNYLDEYKVAISKKKSWKNVINYY